MTLYLDMDGVLADFDEAAGRILGTDNTYRWEWVHGSDAFWEALNRHENFFFNLKPMPDALFLWGNVRQLNPIILTALPNSRDIEVRVQKRMWVDKYLGRDVPMIFTHGAKNKAEHAKPKDVLVDDRLVAAKEWRARGGVYIHHTDATSTLRQLDLLPLEIAA